MRPRADGPVVPVPLRCTVVTGRDAAVRFRYLRHCGPSVRGMPQRTGQPAVMYPPAPRCQPGSPQKQRPAPTERNRPVCSCFAILPQQHDGRTLARNSRRMQSGDAAARLSGRGPAPARLIPAEPPGWLYLRCAAPFACGCVAMARWTMYHQDLSGITI